MEIKTLYPETYEDMEKMLGSFDAKFQYWWDKQPDPYNPKAKCLEPVKIYTTEK